MDVDFWWGAECIGYQENISFWQLEHMLSEQGKNNYSSICKASWLKKKNRLHLEDYLSRIKHKNRENILPGTWRVGQ